MDMILRAGAMYLIVWALLRFSGRRTMSEMTTFDFVLLLICGEATQQALLAEDFSITNAAGVVLSLVFIDRVVTTFRARSQSFERIVEGLPIVIFSGGTLLKDRLDNERINEDDILHEARRSQGIMSLDEIKYAVLEPSGGISIIPKKDKS